MVIRRLIDDDDANYIRGFGDLGPIVRRAAGTTPIPGETHRRTISLTMAASDLGFAQGPFGNANSLDAVVNRVAEFLMVNFPDHRPPLEFLSCSYRSRGPLEFDNYSDEVLTTSDRVRIASVLAAWVNAIEEDRSGAVGRVRSQADIEERKEDHLPEPAAASASDDTEGDQSPVASATFLSPRHCMVDLPSNLTRRQKYVQLDTIRTRCKAWLRIKVVGNETRILAQDWQKVRGLLRTRRVNALPEDDPTPEEIEQAKAQIQEVKNANRRRGT